MTNIVGPLAPFRTIDDDEVARAANAIEHAPLSGFIAAREDGGRYVSLLERLWMVKLGIKHAISFNSATSALLAAAVAVDIRGKDFLVSPFTMSATAAAPIFAGGRPIFVDIEPLTFGIDPSQVVRRFTPKTKAVFATNLFGHTVELSVIRSICDRKGVFLIEDASQSPMATDNGVLAGTIGHIGVFSLNVHKVIQCGEGGIAVTNDDSLAFRMRCVRNHGENLKNGILGLNLRMNEPTAAIACAQMDKLDGILEGRIALAEALTKQIEGLDEIRAPTIRKNCRHVYYSWPILLNFDQREAFLTRINALGVPLSRYVKPLYHLDTFKAPGIACPMAEEIYNRLALFEVCGWSPSDLQIRKIGKAFRQALDEVTQSV